MLAQLLHLAPVPVQEDRGSQPLLLQKVAILIRAFLNLLAIAVFKDALLECLRLSDVHCLEGGEALRPSAAAAVGKPSEGAQVEEMEAKDAGEGTVEEADTKPTEIVYASIILFGTGEGH